MTQKGYIQKREKQQASHLVQERRQRQCQCGWVGAGKMQERGRIRYILYAWNSSLLPRWPWFCLFICLLVFRAGLSSILVFSDSCLPHAADTQKMSEAWECSQHSFLAFPVTRCLCSPPLGWFCCLWIYSNSCRVLEGGNLNVWEVILNIPSLLFFILFPLLKEV